MKSKEIPAPDKGKILITLLYARQTWALTNKITNKLEVCQNSMQRSLLDLKIKNKMKLVDIRQTKVVPITKT